MAVLVVLVASAASTAGAVDTFAIQGELDGLYPGFSGVLNATVTNTLDVGIHVTRVDAAVAATNADGCAASSLSITPTMITSFDLAPGQSASVPLAAHMDAAAPDACQGATFALAFEATSLAQDRPPQALAFTGSNTDVLAITGLTMLMIGILFVRREPFRAIR
jgi:hypothetical protein